MATGYADYVDASFCFNGGCLRCMKEANRLIDTGADVPYEGIMALCTGCIADLAAQAGFRIYDVASHEEHLTAVINEAVEWKRRAEAAEDTLLKVSSAATRIKKATDAQ